MESLVAGLDKTAVATDPFPHIAVADALGDELCNRLQAEFPPFELITGGERPSSNARFDLNAAQVLDNAEVSPTWREFVAYHSSGRFLNQLLELFGDHIRTTYPSFEEEHGRLESLRSGIRYVDSFEQADVLMDAQISINTPVVAAPSSVRRAHLDNPTKLFAGLFYLRAQDDASSGGDLELYRFRHGPRGFRGEAPYETFLDVAATVPYRRNMLIIFLNSPTSVHGVTVRSRTNVARYFVNLIASVGQPLFDLTPLQATMPDKLIAGPEIVSRKLRKLGAGAR